MRILFLALSLSLFMFSCKSDKSKSASTTTAPAKTEVKKKYTLTPFTPSPEFKDASIESMSYRDGKFNFGVKGTDYKLGEQTPDAAQKMCANSGKGQHIHLIVDNAPYAAKYVSEFDYEIADGDHYLLAFLSRSYHESIKSPTSYTAQKINVKNNTLVGGEPISSPMLFYSRPKGTYTGKANTDKVMLDFFLANAQLGANYKVKAAINGEEHLLDKWQPYYIEGMPIGENTITLTLLDKDGKKADVPLNPVTRKFTLAADPVEQ